MPSAASPTLHSTRLSDSKMSVSDCVEGAFITHCYGKFHFCGLSVGCDSCHSPSTAEEEQTRRGVFRM